MTNQDRLIRWPELHQTVALGRSTIWRMEREGTFPLRKQITQRSVGWLKSEVDAWLLSRDGVRGSGQS